MHSASLSDSVDSAVSVAPEVAAKVATGDLARQFRQRAEILRWPTRESGLTERDLELAHGGAFTQADVEAAFAAGVVEGQVRARMAAKPAKRRGGRR